RQSCSRSYPRRLLFLCRTLHRSRTAGEPSSRWLFVRFRDTSSSQSSSSSLAIHVRGVSARTCARVPLRRRNRTARRLFSNALISSLVPHGDGGCFGWHDVERFRWGRLV